MVDVEARERIHTLEVQAVQRDHEIAKLSKRLSHVAAALEAIRPLDSPAVPSTPSASPASPLKADAFDELRAEIGSLKAWQYGFSSLIVADFPALFAEFRGKRFLLLWRGGRDGFRVRDFHRRCDGHANTLTLIEDTEGNIFGGFTPVKWDSNSNGKPDPSLKSFLFTLKNPHNFPARTFALKDEAKDRAIMCDSSLGPYFCGGIGVCGNCNANAGSYTYSFGNSYANDTGLDEKTFFTGSEYFKVKEIEVFEIAD
jgi:hypothetical protein